MRDRGGGPLHGARAGWSQVEITPPLGLPMGGRGPRYTPGASVESPLYAGACVFEDPRGRRTLWVSLDLIGLDTARGHVLRLDIAAHTGVPYEAVILNYAHTHSGPMGNAGKYASLQPASDALAAYGDDLHDRILRLACDAAERLRPAAIHLHRGTSDLGINRRRPDARGEIALAPNPDGSYNRDLWVFDVAGEDGGRCLLFNYGCHPVIAYGFTWDGISSDYPGACRRELRARLGDDVHCQFIQGLAGNVRPRVLADLSIGRFRTSSPHDLAAAGRQLAEDVLAALDEAGEPLDLDLAAVSGWAHPERDRSSLPALAHWQAMAEQDDELSRNLGRYWAAQIEGGIPPVRAVPWEVGMLRLTRRHRVAWMAGEVVAEWQSHLRQWLDDERLMVWGYCQDVPAYLPTDELLPQGGYEVAQSNLYAKDGPTPFAPGLNDCFRARYRQLAAQLGAVE